MPSDRLRVAESLSGVPAAQWNALAADDPFVSHEFLSALIETGCASARSGWRPQLLLLERDGLLLAAMPLFLKSHSWGEYVFDWAWAEAYERSGLAYYPKLVCAVPFTPVTGARLLATADDERRRLARAALELAREVSSLHVLFPTGAEARLLQEQGMLLRRTVQFHWQNCGYADFDAFLAGLTRQRRKVIRQERRRVREARIGFRWLRGSEIGEAEWAFFHRCYRLTYAAHRSSPYLSLEFFRRLGATLPESVLMILAERAGGTLSHPRSQPVAASLLVLGNGALYGRYWGAVEHVPLLHFETCYYQAIEYAIAQRLARFEGGAQGEHKLFRGLMPVETLSAHWLTHRRFARAIEDYLERETAGIARYVDELREHAPFKTPASPSPGGSG